MNALRIVAIALIVAGSLAMAYGGFSYTRDTHHAKLGPLEFTVADKERVNIPMWLGAGSLIAGVVLLVFRTKA